ncbi:DUF1707 SHOCT-like domain-containing protein [Corynebacterium endometrii]|uniref:DUF1707 domain-containing protein n=1 Tax=Corynebacterium endometrii TaxID=2488819 RepID=A0A4P7QI49_9CORY|nr:DUF1707 domain-containing protein [Corynebacterium endometrii]QCB29339.1 hypothetical protein CENDO_10425 [Corynebacterium endometrii]
MNNPHGNAFRLSDSERNDAMNQLARAVGEGRLTIEEFEERSDDIMAATTRRELVPIFADIPAQASTEVKIYSQGDIDRARQAGAKPRLATALATTFVAGPASIFMTAVAVDMGSVTLGVGALALAVLVPVTWIMLYVAKIGPAHWYTPSPRQIERQRMRELQAANAEEAAQRKALQAQLWAERRQQANELTGEAMDLAKRQLSKWNGKK